MHSNPPATTNANRLPNQPGYADPEEAKAISLLKNGNIAGLASLVNRHQVQAVHVALLIVRDRTSAEDIVQDAFLKAYRKIRSFDSIRPFKPWFLRMVINDAIKCSKRNARNTSLDELQETSRAVIAAEWLAGSTDLPETALEFAERKAEIWQALALLTPDQRAAIVLRYFLDATEKEMIEELDKPLSTVKWWLYSARKQLKLILQTAAARQQDQEITHE